MFGNSKMELILNHSIKITRSFRIWVIINAAFSKNIGNLLVYSSFTCADRTHSFQKLTKIILSKSNQFGIYNFSNEGKASWYDFARKIFELNNVAINLKPIPTSEFPTPAKRPEYSVLDKSKIKAEFNIRIHTWEEALLKHK